MARWTGDVSRIVVDNKVVSDEPAGNDRSRREWLDLEVVVVPGKFCSRCPRSIGRIREDLKAVWLSLHKLNTSWPVGSVGGCDLDRGDDPGVGFDAKVGLEAASASSS